MHAIVLEKFGGILTVLVQELTEDMACVQLQ
jgi:hypothetical protein